MHQPPPPDLGRRRVGVVASYDFTREDELRRWLPPEVAWTTYDALPRLEESLGKPVVSANQATVWALLGAVGERAYGPGQRLLGTRA